MLFTIKNVQLIASNTCCGLLLLRGARSSGSGRQVSAARPAAFDDCTRAARRNCLSQRCVPIVRCSSSNAAAHMTQLQQEQVDGFVEFLLAENEKYNLTGAKDAAEVRSRHVQDCIALLPVLDAAMPSTERPSLLDIGSGAGLPGLLLAICRPQWQVTMLDALKKRCGFVDAAAARLGLTNVSTVWARAEDAGHDVVLREAFDVVTARAVAEMPVLTELCMPFVRLDGRLVVAKGAAPEVEVAKAARAIGELGGKLEAVALVDSHGPQGQRTVVIVHKSAVTPAKYPRKPQQLAKRPLL